MTDSCKIVRPARSNDEAFDDVTGDYTQGTTPVYTGKCFVSTQGWQPANILEGGEEVMLSSFKLVLPLAAQEVLVRDVVLITKSLRSPFLSGQSFDVLDRIDTSHAVSQNLLIQRHEGLPPL